jgi:hypothetical protein
MRLTHLIEHASVQWEALSGQMGVAAPAMATEH